MIKADKFCISLYFVLRKMLLTLPLRSNITLLQELSHLKGNTSTAGTTRGLKTCTGRGWWSSALVIQGVTSLWRAAGWQSRLESLFWLHLSFLWCKTPTKEDLCVLMSSPALVCRCIWAPVVVPGSSARFPTTACQWTWSTTHALSTSCSSCYPWASLTGLVRRNSTPCMTTPCTPSNPYTG